MVRLSFVTMWSIIVEKVSATQVGLVMIGKKKLLDNKFMHLCTITDRLDAVISRL